MSSVNNKYLLSFKNCKNHSSLCYDLELFFILNQEEIRNNNHSYKLTLKDLRNFSKVKDLRNRDIEYSLNNLISASYKFKTNKQFKELKLIKSFTCHKFKRSKIYTIKFHKQIFKNLKTNSNYTQFNLNNALSLKQISYSRNLYLLLSKFSTYNNSYITRFDILKKVLGISDKFKGLHEFKPSLRKALKEINDKTDLQITFETTFKKHNQSDKIIFFKIVRKFKVYPKEENEKNMDKDIKDKLDKIGYKLHRKGAFKIQRYLKRYGKDCFSFVLEKLSENYTLDWASKMLDSKILSYSYEFERLKIKEKNKKIEKEKNNLRDKEILRDDKIKKAYKKFKRSKKYQSLFEQIKEKKKLSNNSVIDIYAYSYFCNNLYKEL